MSSYGLWFDNSAPYINWLEAVCKSKGYQLLAQPATGYKVTNDGVGVEGLWGTYPSMIFFADSEGKFFGTGVDVDWTGILAEYATEKGATFHYNTPAVQLVRDGSGRVTSVIAENESGEYIKFNATKGILLATGDMGADMAMTEYYNPSLRKVGRSVVETKDTGNGQKMGMWIGADMDDFAAGDLFPFVCTLKDGTRPDTTKIRSYAAVASLPMLMVDSSGRRIAAEDLPFQAFSIPKLTATPDGHAWTIWDSAWESKLIPGSYLVADYLSINTQEQLEKDVTAGVTQKFDTLDALIEGVGFDASIFTEAVERYNRFCAEGVDLDFYKAAGWLTPLDTPPYYASMHVVSLTSTRGGLRNDEHMRVLDKMGLPIPGLYAAGNTAGSFYGNVYPPNIMGSGIGHGQCFSWLAIKDMLGLDYIR
jgi:succinate dehydrogenase/fumarate reductase flavoprotein subunit